MPSIGFGEIVVILLFALIIFGPKRLPEIGRTIGKSLREFRRSAAEFRADLEDDMDFEDRPSFPKAATKQTQAGEKPPEVAAREDTAT